MITQDRLQEVLDYNPETGVFTWKEDRGGRVKAGDIAGSKDTTRYKEIWIDGKSYYAHRLAFLYVDGYSPTNDIDHIDKDLTNNRRNNLRETDMPANIQNAKSYSNNTSGVKGVHWYRRSNKWQAHIKINGKSHNLGYYTDFNDAVRARFEKEKQVGWSDDSSPAYIYLRDNNLL